MYRYFFVFLCGMLMMSGIAFFKGEAEASCGSANCFLVTGTQEGVFQPGQVVVDLSYRYIPQDRMMKGSSSTDDVLVPKVDFAGGGLELDHHRELRTINMLSQLDLSYGLSSVVTGALAVPFSNRRLHEHDDEVGTVDEHFTNTDGTSGFGDMALTGKGALLVTTKHLLVGGVGIKFPTGEYKLRDSEGAINEPTIMPGTGSFDLLLSGYYSYGWHPHEMDTFLSFLYRLNTENPLDYKFGNATMVNGGINYIPAEKVTLTGQVNARFAGRDEFKGESVPSTGGTFVYLTPGVRVQASPNTAFYTHLQMPVYQKVNEVNLAPRYGLLLGVSYAF